MSGFTLVVQSNTLIAQSKTIELRLGLSVPVVVQSSPGGGDGSNELKEDLSPLLTIWTLSAVPSAPHMSKLFINGQKQTFGIDYVVNGGLVSWLGYALKPNWKVEFYYS